MLRLAQETDFDQVVRVYDDSMTFAEARHGNTDWDISQEYFGYLVGNGELFLSDDGKEEEPEVHGATTLGERFNPQEWAGTEPETGLYLGKLATDKTVRGTRYVARVMLPAILEVAASRGKDSVRLNFMDDNEGLRRLYTGLGFTQVGMTTFYSRTREKDLTTVNMVKPVS